MSAKEAIGMLSASEGSFGSADAVDAFIEGEDRKTVLDAAQLCKESL